MISSTDSTFEDFVNSSLNLANNYQSDDAYGTVIAEAVSKIAMYPFEYTDFDSVSRPLTVS